MLGDQNLDNVLIVVAEHKVIHVSLAKEVGVNG